MARPRELNSGYRPPTYGKANARLYLPCRSASYTVHEVFAILESSGLSQGIAADAIGATRTTLSTWKRGANTPSILSIEELAAFLGYRIALVPIDPPTNS